MIRTETSQQQPATVPIMARMEFITVDPSSMTSVPAGTRHRIRVQVMKDFRRKEREKQANANAG